MSVSVVIPCFNLGEYVREAVDSVRGQTRTPDELVIVDDGSDDAATLEVLGELERDGVTVLRQDNAGASAARNAGIAATEGELILCLDADDLLLPQFIQATSEALQREPEAGIAATGVEFFGEVVGTWQPQGHSVEAMLARNCLPSASMFRRRCWEEAGGYRDLRGAQDWDLWLAILARGWRWTVVPEVLYRYRRRRGSVSDVRDAHREPIMRDLLKQHASLYKDRWVDVFIEMDAQLEAWRQRAARLQNDGTSPGIEPPTTAVTANRDDRTTALGNALAGLPSAARVLVAGMQTADTLAFTAPEVLLSEFPHATNAAFGGQTRPDGQEAVRQLERRRAEGAEYLVLPAAGPSRRSYDAALREHLEATYPVVHSDEENRVYDITEYHTFSVVICTHNRAGLLPDAIASTLDQVYPSDRFELIVVDNASSDDTQHVIEGLRSASPVDYRSVVEDSLGLSYARNRGIAEATHEYVAFLDDDAVAAPRWLRAFNRVINEHRALVVGGRVDKSFPAGFELPEWFNTQYLTHHFGVNYRERGRNETVIRIRQPLYLSGGNTAYAKRLFDHFGGFNCEFGRKGAGGLLASEETILNMQLERAGIPLYYTDEAYIRHFVDAWRVEKGHLRKKSYWSGATRALVDVTFHGYDEMRERRTEIRRELRQRMRQMAGKPGHRETFTWRCRISFCAGYMRMARRLLRERRRGRPIQSLPEPRWGTAEWREEVRRWPDGPAKYQQLAELALEAGHLEDAEEAVSKLEEIAPVDESMIELAKRIHETRYERALAGFKDAVDSVVPSGKTVAVVSRGDDELLELDGRQGHHFPAAQGGSYAGSYPADSASAIRLVEKTRVKGAHFLAFPEPALWWLEHYDGMCAHLEGHYRRMHRTEGCVIFDLTSRPDAASAGREAPQAADLAPSANSGV